MTGGHTRFGARAFLALTLVAFALVVMATPPAARADVGLFEDGWAVVAHDGGDGVRIRPNPDTYHGIKAVAPSGALLKLKDGPFTDKDGLIWFHVTYSDVDGYAQVYYLAPSDHNGNIFSKGIIANTGGDPIRVRQSPGGEVITYVYEGNTYPITGGLIKDSKGQGWYQINKNNQFYGWLMADYIYPYVGQSAPPKSQPAPTPTRAPKAVAPAPIKAAPAPAPTATPVPYVAPAASNRGDAIVATARKYLGYPYVWGGASPKAGGFDCSGFVYWVVTQNGVSTGRNIEDEATVGSHVEKSDLQPGDLVFFANTYKAGLSHAGIYIGGGQFIHAENYGTGVTISNINNGYYGSRYAGARRV